MKGFLTSKWTSKWMAALEQKGGEKVTYKAVDNMAGLIELAQIGTLELHPWSSGIDRPERSDCKPGLVRWC